MAPSPRAQPVIIIGAARSGTNMLRDCLTALPGVGTWPCDEINYIWRHGNKRYPTDEFSPDRATGPVKRYIRRAFDRVAEKQRLEYVVEKTCANSLRVGFVDRVVPEAKFIFLVRDGRDVVASAMKRWTAPLDPGYLLRKARYVPPADLPFYAWRYLCNRAFRLVSRERRLAFWGPKFEGMRRLLDGAGLTEVCAAQWARCVRKASQSLDRIEPGRVCRVRYEDYVHRPRERFRRICDFLDIEAADDRIDQAVRHVSPHRAGLWPSTLSAADRRRIAPILRPALSQLGYDTAHENQGPADGRR